MTAVLQSAVWVPPGTTDKCLAGGELAQGPVGEAGRAGEPGLVQPGVGQQVEPMGTEPGRAEQEVTPWPSLLLRCPLISCHGFPSAGPSWKPRDAQASA